ncbi:Peptidyl-prolyl cis-trans isomerase (rotamase)-cyclophilin family [Saccharicrinis carchari]|uniref:peptidylprolyl isomerase n=1 Tax=Saccharicrinis carchari TaxID=1168039 RepID=A0A521EFP2_SACCC|nr:peptidylprolyl isomerase [Saccharicrinis carchari]SMO82743.1 Peptidyl-prolyl cis-trans isomerase (rotamase)-cyclophilin family [Saccharicrinis carchari]
MNKLGIILLVSLILVGCKSGQERKGSTKPENIRPKGSYQRNIKGIVRIQTYDHYNRTLKKGYGFYITANLLVTHLDLIKGAFKAKAAIIGSDNYNDVAGYTAYSIDQNLVILKTWKKNLNYLDIDKAIRSIPDTVAGLYRKQKKMYAPKAAVKRLEQDSITHYLLSREIYNGLPAFNYLHHLVGLVQSMDTDTGRVSVLIPSANIAALAKNQLEQPASIYELRNKSNKVYPSYKSIEAFRIVTSMGNITIKLDNRTPVFRDNFIKLVSDQFYDSLLVHRVIHNFLIQTGAADSKYADKDDIVGWQGPGYDLKTNVVPGLYHKRGAVAASKMPAERNPRNRSDGSQFYIVSGRLFTLDELKDLEKDKGIKFTQQQINTYTTLGGAPHLDGDYTVFGEVIGGMDVVDKIAAAKTYAVDRPVDDIRILKIEMLRK